MIEVIVQAAIIICCGLLWQRYSPDGVGGAEMRRALISLVYKLLLPALVLGVLWQAPLGLNTLFTILLAASGVFWGMALAALWFRFHATANRAVGAMIIAAAFPNATYLGLPLLEATFGEWARAVAIQYDLLACTPLLLSVGVLIAIRKGGSGEAFHPLSALLRVPPLWAALAGVLLNLSAVPLPDLLAGLLEWLGAAVVPLMLFSIGLSLRWPEHPLRELAQVAPVVVIQLLLTPLMILLLGTTFGIGGEMRTALVLEGGMPSMVLGIVLCDRYQLDSGLYASAVTLTTTIAIATLPLWYWVVETGQLL